MVKLQITKGKWQKGITLHTLIWEYCHNPDCKMVGRLHYPTFLIGPHCPECKTDLIGHRLVEGHGKRMAYHLEGK